MRIFKFSTIFRIFFYIQRTIVAIVPSPPSPTPLLNILKKDFHNLSTTRKRKKNEAENDERTTRSSPREKDGEKDKENQEESLSHRRSGFKDTRSSVWRGVVARYRANGIKSGLVIPTIQRVHRTYTRIYAAVYRSSGTRREVEQKRKVCGGKMN